jgi:hypothetical protein
MPNQHLQNPILVKQLQDVYFLVKLLDGLFKIPMMNKFVGIDAIAGLLPGLGDLFTLLPSVYILWRARALGVPNQKILIMISNLVIDTTVGSIPFVGDWFDFFWQANIKNMNIILRHFGLPDYQKNGSKTPSF